MKCLLPGREQDVGEKRSFSSSVDSKTLHCGAVTSNPTHGAGTHAEEPGDRKDSRVSGSGSRGHGGGGPEVRDAAGCMGQGPNQKSADVLRLQKCV